MAVQVLVFVAAQLFVNGIFVTRNRFNFAHGFKRRQQSTSIRI